MSNPSLQLRAGQSGQTFEDSTPGFVLTIDTDGKSVKPAAAASGGLVSFNGRTAPAAVPTSGDYDASEVTNDSDAPGVSTADALSNLANAPSFPVEDNFGNVTGAMTIPVALHLARFFTLTGNATLMITGLVAGRSQWGQFRVIQGGAGNFTLTIAGAQTPGGSGLSLSSAVGAQDIVSFFWSGTTLFAQVAGLAFA